MGLDQKQAEAAAEAIMLKDKELQAAAQKERQASGAALVVQQRAAVIGLVGFGVGALIGYLTSYPMIRAAVIGGAGSVLFARFYWRLKK